MGIKTRLDGRTKDNNSLKIKDAKGEVIVEITLLNLSGSTLEITTKGGLFLEKPNQWSSKPSKCGK